MSHAARAAAVGSLEAGEYIVLKVIDCGTGIAPDVVERMFDPFFTTKEVGVGSGEVQVVEGVVAVVERGAGERCGKQLTAENQNEE